ncbi:winged helix-turn-helix transcriptional regulator [Pedobacter sandarakinus]|uniref:winged helix-turn-helix transcriptional regulator n=1 Tax=Pedobacter sandarakinus TaxID=353156 RepID=UPI002245C0F8|nr:helix-turn-helix domain-containing protein [Pedobacter sandarakinus]MCX2575104.1 helix-turn-helix domain-containing protein [Pedobacter sandarakinus]
METLDVTSFPSSQQCATSLKHVFDAMYVLNGKWKLPLVLCLMHGPKRFNQIQKEMMGISPKVLASELKDLEINFLIERKVYSSTPVNIRYEATAYSHTLKTILGELSEWGKMHREHVRGISIP